jgi:hypothetical protein
MSTPDHGHTPSTHLLWTTTRDYSGGEPITSPRATDKERQACKLHISRHDIAGLASPAYHGGRTGVPDLSLGFIHACGYQTFSPEIDDDVLPCYSTIQLLHRKVKNRVHRLNTFQKRVSLSSQSFAVLLPGRRFPFTKVFNRSPPPISCQSCRSTQYVSPTTTKVYSHQASAPTHIANVWCL